MNTRKRRIVLNVAAIFFMLILLSQPVTALELGKSYLYNHRGEAVPAPSGYVCERVLYGSDLGIGSFQKPQDLAVDQQGYLYMADTNNNRIVILKPNLSFDRVIEKVKLPSGEQQSLSAPQGVSVAGDLLFICDTGSGRVWGVDKDNIVKRTLTKPVTELISKDAEFKPSKVVVNDSGTAYVVASGIYQGLLQYDKNDAFLGFFGANRVEVTASVLIRNFWKNLFTDEQRASLVRTVPTEYTNAYIDQKGMIFTATSTVSSGQVRQLNASGDNILRYPGYNSSLLQMGYDKNNFGDQDVDYQKGNMIQSRIVDVQVDKDGILSVLDNQRGRIFQYDKEQNPLCIFGGKGEQQGFFKNASAVEKLENRYLVTDMDKNCLTVFKPVPYILTVRAALNAYDKGDYEEAAALWETTLQQNGGLSVACRGIGRARLQQGRYQEAMTYLKNGDDRYFYSLAVQQYRREFVRKNLWWLFPLAVTLIVGFVWLLKGIKKAILRSAEKEGRPI